MAICFRPLSLLVESPRPLNPKPCLIRSSEHPPSPPSSPLSLSFLDLGQQCSIHDNGRCCYETCNTNLLLPESIHRFNKTREKTRNYQKKKKEKRSETDRRRFLSAELSSEQETRGNREEEAMEEERKWDRGLLVLGRCHRDGLAGSGPRSRRATADETRFIGFRGLGDSSREGESCAIRICCYSTRKPGPCYPVCLPFIYFGWLRLHAPYLIFFRVSLLLALIFGRFL